ncbi:MAG: DUF4139 domain-containing protein [Bacteroidia bacterium]
MKKLIFALLLLMSVSVQAQNKPIKAHLQKVQVFLQGAYLHYSENVYLLPGNNEFIFENISPVIDENSLQATTKSGVVMETTHNILYKEKPKKTGQYDKALRDVRDSIEEIRFDLKEIDYKYKVIVAEKNLLVNNRMMKGDFPKDSLPLLKDALNLLKDRLSGILEQEFKLDKNKAKKDKVLAQLQVREQNLMNLQNGQYAEGEEESVATHRVIVTVYAESPANTQLHFNYLISNASWTPSYDLKAEEKSKNMQLIYFASINQQSGIDWKNVNMSISTTNAYDNNTKPELSPWVISFIEYFNRTKRKAIGITSNSVIPMQKESVTLDNNAPSFNDDMAEQKSITDFIEVTENLIRTEYDIKLNYEINSDGKNHKVMINQKNIPMQLEFAAVPKLSTDAFLMAGVGGWEDLNILPGKARIHFDGLFAGEIMLMADGVKDTIYVNLGKDRTIGLSRKKIKEKYKVKMIDQEKVETRSIELLVRNSKNIPIEIKLEDQIPVVQGTEEIKVNLLDGDGAELDPLTGLLTWKLKLNSKESKKIIFTYEVRYPKGRTVANL